MTLRYAREHFQHTSELVVEDFLLRIDSSVYPVKFRIGEGMQIFTTCEGELVCTNSAGSTVLEAHASLSFRTKLLGIEVETLLAPLILDAADIQGIPVGHRCAESCAHAAESS